MTRRSSWDRSDAIHSASRSADSATNRRDAADFEVPSPAMTGRSPSGSRTARLSLRVDTLISIRFIAQRPSQSSACAAVQVGSGSFTAVEAAHPRAMHRNLAAVEADLALRRAPAVADPASTAAMRRAGELLGVLAQHLLDGSDAGRQTEALE